MGSLFSRSRPAAPRPEAARNRLQTPEATASADSSQAADNAHYIQELADIQEFLVNLDQFISRDPDIAGQMLGLDKVTMDSYLEALNVKMTQLNGIRRYLHKNPQIPNRHLLQQMLEEVQPKCIKLKEIMARLRHILTTEGEISKMPGKQLLPASGVGSNQPQPPASSAGFSQLQPSTSGAGSNQPQPPASSAGFSQLQPSTLVAGSNQPQPPASSAGFSQLQPSTSGAGSNQLQPLVSSIRCQPIPHLPSLTMPRNASDPRLIIPLVHPPCSSASSLPQLLASDSEDSDENEDDENGDDEDEDNNHKSNISEYSTNGSENIDDWRGKTVSSAVKEIHVDRSKPLLDIAVPIYASIKAKNLRCQTVVSFKGEQGIDMGGLTKEFFYILFQSVISESYKCYQLMIGERRHLIPDSSTDCRIYVHIGRMIVHSVVNGCRGLPDLSPAIVHFLVKGMTWACLEESHPPVCIDDVADTALKQILTKLEDQKNLSESEKETLEVWMSESGCPVHLGSPLSHQLILQHLLIYYIFTKRSRQIESLAEGMNALKLREFLTKNRSDENISFVFPSTEETSYTDDIVIASIVTRGDDMDVSVFYFFKQFVSDLYQRNIADFCLSDLIQFITSSPYAPPALVVSFSVEIVIPVAHSCNNEITLPLVHQTYDEFKQAFITALRNGTTKFGLQ